MGTSPDDALPQHLPGGVAELSARKLVAVIAAAGFLVPLNSSMIAVALPRVRDDFGVGVGLLTLLVTVYLVAVAVSQPVSGKLGDAVGHRRMILAGLALLFLSSLAATLSWSFWVLIVARAFQGISAAMVMPNGIAYLRRHIDSDVLGKTLGYNGAAISAGAAMGPVLGGVAVSLWGWRSMFLINVPAAIVIAALVLALPRDEGERKPITGIDLPSLASLLAAFTGLAVLGNARRFESPALVLAAMLILPLAVASYAWLYRKRGTGVVELRLFSNRDYAVAGFSTAFANLVMYTALIAMPIYLDELRNVGGSTIGLLLFSMSVASVAVSPLAGNLADRLGYRRPLLAGGVILIAGAAALAGSAGQFAVWTVAAPLGVIGLGMALSQSAAQAAALRAWGPEVAGSAAGTQSMMRYVGSVAGAAIMAAVLGSQPTTGEVRLLLWIVSAAAVANFAVSLAAPRGRVPLARVEPSPARSQL